MVKIQVLPHPELCPTGTQFEAPAGQSICEALLQANVGIEHACDMSCACTTCHVIVRSGGEGLNPAGDEEEDLLDRAWGLQPQSRLSCQALVGRTDLLIELPRYTLNHARER